MALIFLMFGAPDLALTQLLVETLSVVILALVMSRLHLSAEDPRPYEDWLRDGELALVMGVAATLLLLRSCRAHSTAASAPSLLAPALPSRMAATSSTSSSSISGWIRWGRFQWWMTAGIAVLALLRRQHKRAASSEAGHELGGEGTSA